MKHLSTKHNVDEHIVKCIERVDKTRAVSQATRAESQATRAVSQATRAVLSQATRAVLSQATRASQNIHV